MPSDPSFSLSLSSYFLPQAQISSLGEPFSAELLRQTLLAESELPDTLLQQQKTYQIFYGLHDLPTSHYQQGCCRSSSYEVIYQIWRPLSTVDTKGTFYLVHGYYDHSALYRYLISGLLEQGFVVVALDLPGHGLSSGPRASIITFEQYTKALWQVIQLTSPQLPEPFNLIGQSTGGAILIDWWLNSGYQKRVNIQKTVLLSPLVKPCNWQQGLLSYYLLSPFISRIKRGYSKNSHNESFLGFLQDDPLQPRHLAVDWVGALKNWIPRIENAKPVSNSVLILQGGEDKTVDWRFNTRLLAQKFPQAQISYFPEARHHLVNESRDIRQQCFNRLWHFLSD